MAIFGPRHSRNGSRLQARNDHVAVLDLGASAAKCLIARREPAGGFEVRGFGRAPNHGVKAGDVVDMDAAETAIRGAVEEAERMASVAVDAVTVGFHGGQLASHSLFGEALLTERPASDRDLRSALDAAMAEFEADDRVAFHAIPLAWSIDAHRGVRDPRGMYGRSIGVEMHVVSAASAPVRNLTLCIERARLQLRNLVATPYASGLATLVPDEVDLGVTLLDMGASTTTAAVFIDGALVHVDAAPIGGAHVSNDIARGLSTPIAEGERIKRRYGSLLEKPGDRDEMIEFPQLGDRDARAQAPRSLIRKIVRPRIEETLELVRDRLGAAGVLRAAGPRAVLTGGASQLEGVSDLAEEILGKRVRVARPPRAPGLPDGDDGPEMAAALGLLRHVISGPREAIAGPPRLPEEMRPRGGPERAPIKRAAGWLWENF
jgi:cell division protein FtsA